MNHLLITILVLIQVLLHNILLVQVNINTSFNNFVFLLAWNIYLMGIDTSYSYGFFQTNTSSRHRTSFSSLEWKSCLSFFPPPVPLELFSLTSSLFLWLMGEKCELKESGICHYLFILSFKANPLKDSQTFLYFTCVPVWMDVSVKH